MAPVIIIVFIVLAIVIRFAAGSTDEDRIREHIEEQNGKLLSSEWNPFGKGWFGDKNDRIYEVRYLDAEGNEHIATCKTSMFSGVYFTGDQIVHAVEKSSSSVSNEDRLAQLEQENQTLKDALKRTQDHGA